MRIVDIILNVIGWLQIAIGTALLTGLGWLMIYYIDNSFGLRSGVIIMLTGFIVGGAWATRIWIRHGTVGWLSRIRRVE